MLQSAQLYSILTQWIWLKVTCPGMTWGGYSISKIPEESRIGQRGRVLMKLTFSGPQPSWRFV
ncbi:hypothetical protein CS542_03230 [Pedobacter sp. IW39]|nr:hypothetical protein CS542_03230 [Pedobacter sp. IW39]